LVKAWVVDDAAGGARLRIDLADDAVIKRRFLLPPADGVANYRYVIDLASTGPVAARPAQRATLVSMPAARAPVLSLKKVIVIDAGHGGHDPGAHGAHNVEKTLTLAAAKALKARLERSGRYTVVMTRSTDTYVGLDQRVAIARRADADLFISLHADAGTDASLRGASVYTLSEQGASRAVREVTRSDNWHRDLHLPGRDPSVDRILLDMTQRATQNRSAQFARVLLTHMEAADLPLLRRSHRDAGLAVLLAPDVPAVLLEMGFITNPEDERALNDERSRRTLMRAVAQGIDRYFAEQTSQPLVTASNDDAG
jgi:N-acetylmuramoyl-L-alanine amidase